MYFPLSNVSFDKIESELLIEKNVTLTIMRLDKIHPIISGNKLFKLHYFIEECLQTKHKTILTFGGAYSNHLAATAFLCKEKKIHCIGIVRGEKPLQLSHTLLQCEKNGMVLHFVDRAAYKRYSTENCEQELVKEFGNFTFIPEGGYGHKGAQGAALIIDLLADKNPTHICTCVGTATTLAGLLMKKEIIKNIIAVPVIKNMIDIDSRIKHLLGNVELSCLTNWDEYHFGGYAKHTDELLSFMNNFYDQYKIPTDFVYTAKMMYGIMEKINTNYFKPGSHIMALHTGGLQGNDSLEKGALIF